MPYIDTRKTFAALALGAVLITTQGCSRLRTHQGYVGDATLLASVQPGVDNKDSVQQSLGRPTFTGQFSNNDWYYYARDTKQLAFSEPVPTSQFVLHVQFDNAGNVIVVKKGGMENIARLSPESDKTPTLGKDRTFFEDIFGNIGSVGGVGGGAGGGGPQ
jgi:outer membrane protein assembly factor BamE (lipoprotein component of BamABCDE complex)